MLQFSVRRTVPANPSRVWNVLTDPNRLGDGSFGIVRLKGEIEKGHRITVWSEVDPKRPFPVKVVHMRPEKEMIWEGGLPLGLFVGRRRFTLSAVDEGTMFEMREDYVGPLAPLMSQAVPDLTPSFETFADGLVAAVSP